MESARIKMTPKLDVMLSTEHGMASDDLYLAVSGRTLEAVEEYLTTLGREVEAKLKEIREARTPSIGRGDLP